MAFQLFGTRIEFIQGDPTEPEADALIIPANDHLWMGAGPARIVKEAGGEEIERAAVREGPSGLGSVVVTEPGTLSFRKILHAVVTGQDLHVKAEGIRGALWEALKRCDKMKAAKVNFVLPQEPGDKPPPPETVAAVVETLFGVLEEVSEVENLRLVVADEKTREVLHNAFLHELQ